MITWVIPQGGGGAVGHGDELDNSRALGTPRYDDLE